MNHVKNTNTFITKPATQLPERRQQLPFPVFNNKYLILNKLGEGMTAKVFLARDIETRQEVAIKFLLKSHLGSNRDRVADFRREISILSELEHEGIVNMIESGEDGICIGKNHDVQFDISYIVLEYYSNEFFNFCLHLGAMGEEVGKYFLK